MSRGRDKVVEAPYPMISFSMCFESTPKFCACCQTAFCADSASHMGGPSALASAR